MHEIKEPLYIDSNYGIIKHGGNDFTITNINLDIMENYRKLMTMFIETENIIFI